MNKVIIFMDNVGRPVIGEQIDLTDDVLKVRNPAVVNVQPVTNGNQQQYQVQMIPLLFPQFVEGNEGPVWEYKRDGITLNDGVVTDQFVNQFNQVVQIGLQEAGQAPQPAPGQEPTGDVVKLFDD